MTPDTIAQMQSVMEIPGTYVCEHCHEVYGRKKHVCPSQVPVVTGQYGHLRLNKKRNTLGRLTERRNSA